MIALVLISLGGSLAGGVFLATWTERHHPHTPPRNRSTWNDDDDDGIPPW